jgi:hypothetical protein
MRSKIITRCRVRCGEPEVGKTESTAQVGVVAEKIRATLAEPYLFLLKIQQEGRMAMYQAKEEGRNLIRSSIRKATAIWCSELTIFSGSFGLSAAESGILE